MRCKLCAWSLHRGAVQFEEVILIQDSFVYGGENPKTGTSGQIHILSIPSFRWFRTEVKSPGRMHHACTVAGNRQMISTGGVSSEWDWEEQDPWRHSLGVFDMTALEWSDRYDADANDYETPEMIRDWFNENPSWESEMEWDDDDVRSLLMNGKTDTPHNQHKRL